MIIEEKNYTKRDDSEDIQAIFCDINAIRGQSCGMFKDRDWEAYLEHVQVLSKSAQNALDLIKKKTK